MRVGALVGRLLLHPDHVGEVRVGAQDLPEFRDRRGVELLDPDECGIGDLFAGLLGQEVVIDLSARQQYSPDVAPVVDLCIVDYRTP